MLTVLIPVAIAAILAYLLDPVVTHLAARGFGRTKAVLTLFAIAFLGTALSLINFGIMALIGVIAGSFLYALFTRSFRIEWFANGADFANHVVGGVLLGIGGVLAMGCTVGQAITGVSTLAIGSLITFVAIVAGSAATMKFQYWRMLREA